MRFSIYFRGERYSVWFNGGCGRLFWLDPDVLTMILSAAACGMAIHDVSRERHKFTEGA